MAGVLMVTGMVVLNPAAAQAAVVWTPIQNRKANYNSEAGVMAISGGVNQPAGKRALVWSWSYSGGQLVGDQQWYIQPVPGNTSYKYIRNAGTANWFALSVQNNDTSNGANVVQWWFDASNPFEQWQLIPNGDNWWQFRNKAAGKCLAIEGGGNNTIPLGAGLIIWTCGVGSDQEWHDASPTT
jgi:hypothetical protein